MKTYHRVLREASEYFMGQGDLQQTLRELARRLDAEGIPYAIVGALAMARHGFVRMTQDVDVLMTAEGLVKFRARCVGRGYAPAFPDARKSFRDTQTQVQIDVITTGEYPGDGKPKSVVFPDPIPVSKEVEGVRVINLPKLIELKLASGMSAAQRLRDLADVQDLIVALNPPLDWGDQLDPSVQEKYRELWRAAHSE